MSGPTSGPGPQRIVDTALRAATADGTVVLVRDRAEANLRWAGSSLTTNGEMTSRSVTVISTYGARVGVVEGSVADVRDVAELVSASETAARTAPPSTDAAPLVEGDSGPDWDEKPATVGIEAFAGLADDLRSVFDEGRGHDAEHFGFAEQQVDTVHLGSSTGLRRRHVQPTGRVELCAKSVDRDHSAYLAHTVRSPGEVDVRAVGSRLHERLGWSRRGRETLQPGDYEVVLPPTTVADLLFPLLFSAAARDSDEGRTCFSAPDGGTRVGEQLCAVPMDLYADPTYPGLECAPFLVAVDSGPLGSVFDNGLPLGRVDLLKDGRLDGLLGSRAYAAETATPVRPVGDNLVLEAPGGSGSTADLVADVADGLLLSTFWYIRTVDPQTMLMTGLTRDGVYRVRDGEVVGAVTNFRWNVSPLTVLARVAAVGATERCYPREWGDWFTRTSMPALRVPGFPMSSISPSE